MKLCQTCQYRASQGEKSPCSACATFDRWEPIGPIDLKPDPIAPLNPTPEIRVQATVVGLGPGRDGLVQVELGFSRTDQIDFCVQAPRDVAAAFLPGDAVTLAITPGAAT